ncbi:MAG: glucose-6-phosphate isomerase, partial [Bacteroidia bacterium]|nr:glucose-6-phosphate isomerase [Bacteroidia bacterium]
MDQIPQTAAWQKLAAHYNSIRECTLSRLFADDPKRAEKFSIEFSDLFLDYSKNLITEETMRLLVKLAKDSGLPQAIEDMFSGKAINV